MPTSLVEPTTQDYERLLSFRTGLRRFLRWSEERAAAAGLTPAQHQLMLAIRGHADERGPTIGEAADYLLLKHHSAVELIDRAAAGGLVERVRDDEDHRIVRLRLSVKGAAKLEKLAAATLAELARLGPSLRGVWRGLEPTGSH